MSFEITDLYKLKFEYHPKYLFAQVGGGNDSLRVSKDYWLKVLSEGEHHDYNKILIVEDLEGKLSYSDTYEFSMWLTKSCLHNFLVAFVDLRPHHQDSNELAELLASNRGFPIKTFADTTEAAEWLKLRR